jgi:hypothetical protein
MKAMRDNILAAVSELERTLDEGDAGRGPDRPRRLGRALAGVEQAVRLHAESLDASGGNLIDVESPRIPSPWVTREVGGLRQELDELLDEVSALREKLSAAGTEVPDFGPFRQRARRLVTSLERYEEEEARVIQEAINTDVGAGE